MYTLLVQFKLVYVPFGQDNIYSTLDFSPRPARKETNVLLRSLINVKAGKAAALPKFSDRLTLSQSGGQGTLCPTIGFASP